MNEEKLMKNIVDQIKEAQIKLGYVKETVRLYYPAASLQTILSLEAGDAKELLEILQGMSGFSNTSLGQLQFAEREGRIEVSVSPEGAQYVHEHVKDPAFLKDIIDLFGRRHNCTLDEIRSVFEKYSSNYVCQKIPEGKDFDYVLYFNDKAVDAYYYCVKREMGHTIYHRFTQEDYQEMLI